MFTLAAAGIGGVQARGAEAQVLGPTGAMAPEGPIAPVRCGVVCGIKAPTPIGVVQGQPHLQVEILSTPMTCDKLYPNDPDVCQEPRFTVSIRVSNLGSESSPPTKFWWQVEASDVCCSGYGDVRPVPALAPGEAENDSWQVLAYNLSGGLPPGSCKILAISLAGTAWNRVSAETQLCNTAG